MVVEDIKIIELPKFMDPRGNLSFVEQNNHIPFEIKRTYWIYEFLEVKIEEVMLLEKQKNLLWQSLVDLK